MPPPPYTLSLSLQDLFNVMPLTALIGSRIFCMHGGLSPDIKSWGDLRDIKVKERKKRTTDLHNWVKRPLEVGETGLAVDLLWSDPEENMTGWQDSSRWANIPPYSSIIIHSEESHSLSELISYLISVRKWI